MSRRPPQTCYAPSSGAKIAYQVSGTGPPDLVMVHGLISHLDLQWQLTEYRRFVRALEQGGRVIRLDKRGTGPSDPVTELPMVQQRVQDVAAVMAAAKSSRAVLFGLSDGGRAAIAFAAAYPGRTRGLILYGTSYRGPRAALLRRYRSAVRHWGARSIGHDAAVQDQLAWAEGALASARCFLFETIPTVWDTACRGDEPSLPQRAQVLLAANQTVRAATEAVDRVFRLAGADAVFAHYPLQRCFRDIHAAGQHILFSSGRDQAFAKVRLGIDQPTYLI